MHRLRGRLHFGLVGEALAGTGMRFGWGKTVGGEGSERSASDDGPADHGKGESKGREPQVGSKKETVVGNSNTLKSMEVTV